MLAFVCSSTLQKRFLFVRISNENSIYMRDTQTERQTDGGQCVVSPFYMRDNRDNGHNKQGSTTAGGNRLLLT